MSTWIKICGTTNFQDAQLAVDAGANAIGFVFAAESPRRIEPEVAAEIVGQLPAGVEKVGVFVNEHPARVREIVMEVGLTVVQLHGREPLAYAEGLFASDEPRPKLFRGIFMSAFSVANQTASLRGHRQRPLYDALLVDSGSPNRGGGTGRTFDWDRARLFVTRLKQHGKVIVAGGLNPENVARAIEVFSPWGVDVASGVEQSKGRKDPQKVRDFVAAVRQAG